MVGTSSTTPGSACCDSAASSASTRSWIAGSIARPNSTTSAASPASRKIGSPTLANERSSG
jgi:hypothetical protein